MHLQNIKVFSHWSVRSIFVALLFFVASDSFAANLSLVPQSSSVNVGDSIRVRVVLSSTDKPANAVSGSIIFPTNLLTLTSFSKSDSIITVWPAGDPTYSNSTGVLNLDGVILSGYQGSNGTILTLFFKAKAPGSANIKFGNSQVLAHDGLGTPILGLANQTTLNILSAPVQTPEVPKIEPVKAPATSLPQDVAPSIEIEEIKKKDPLDPRSRFFITSTLKKANASYKIEIDNNSYVWNGGGTNIFETVPLTKGAHTIKVSFESVNGDIVSDSLNFNTIGLLAPVITDFSKNLRDGDFIVVKGIVDPLNQVIVNTEVVLAGGRDSFRESVTIRSDDKGVFIYVAEKKAQKGSYNISAIARTASGIESPESLPIKISVQADTKSLLGKLTNTFSVVVPAIVVFATFIIIVLYGWHRILHYRERMRRRLLETRALVSKSFSILEEDADEEAKILKKGKALKPLTAEEKEFISQFKKDINSAEKTILNDLKDSDNAI